MLFHKPRQLTVSKLFLFLHQGVLLILIIIQKQRLKFLIVVYLHLAIYFRLWVMPRIDAIDTWFIYYYTLISKLAHIWASSVKMKPA